MSESETMFVTKSKNMTVPAYNLILINLLIVLHIVYSFYRYHCLYFTISLVFGRWTRKG